MKKEFLQIRRDRAMITLIFIMPIAQLVVLGYVVSSEVQNISLVICDLDRSDLSRCYVQMFDRSVYFRLKGVESRYSELEDYLEDGQASVALVIPYRFSAKVRNRQSANIQVLVDGQDTNAATITLGYINSMTRSYFQTCLERTPAQEPAMPFSPSIQPQIRIWYNPELEYSDYMVPGIAAFLLTMITALISAMGLVREREIGTMEQLLVSPLKKHELLIGKILPFAVIGFIELAIAIAFAKLWYNIPIVGNIGLFALFALIYLFTTLGIGLFVSASSQTQQQALFMTWAIAVFAFLMSGFIFPIENMPKGAQLVSYLNPLRYFMVVIRDIFLKGATLRHLVWQGCALVIFSTSIFSIAVVRFQQRMK
jgi:ABC-2 type transport system permease protein